MKPGTGPCSTSRKPAGRSRGGVAASVFQMALTDRRGKGKETPASALQHARSEGAQQAVSRGRDVTQQPDPIGALTAECDELDQSLAGLDDQQWELPTPAPGWTIRHQVAHLAATFRLAGLSASDPDAFIALMERLDQNFTVNVAN